jgi:peptidoglycan-associated lipoprotein
MTPSTADELLELGADIGIAVGDQDREGGPRRLFSFERPEVEGAHLRRPMHEECLAKAASHRKQIERSHHHRGEKRTPQGPEVRGNTGTRFAFAIGMRVLEARFHPWRKARGPFVVVARVLCRRRRAVVERVPAAAEEPVTASQETMLQKLEYLVARSGRDTFHRLQDLRSEFWSFVEIEEGRSWNMITRFALFALLFPLACSHAPAANPVPRRQVAPAAALPPPAPVAIEPPAQPTQTLQHEDAIYFNFDASLIRDDARPILQDLARSLEREPAARVRIEGNCDERGTTEYNLALGEERARAARQYLMRLGIAPGRIEVVTYGSERPRQAGHDESAWAANRRDDFRIRRQ